MMKKYGGVKNQQSIDQIQEAEVHVKPPVNYSTPLILLKIALYAIICTAVIVGVVFVIGWLGFGIWTWFN